MAFQFNQQPQGQAQAQPPTQGIASLPAPSSAQGGFAFQPRAAVQHPTTLPSAQPLTNAQIGIGTSAQQNAPSDAFARSMQQWQAARQAELAGLTASTKAAASTAWTYNPLTGWTQGGTGAPTSNFMGQQQNYGFGMINNPRVAAPPPPPKPVMPTFTTGPIPTDPQQYMAYVAQQQTEFEKQKAAYQNALNAYKG